ncbi:MAG: hypothetical protein JMDDDDMK_04039 [Acidobacteria bacterium]|nr:hypothetical protein [Acidobacteriota bacterium]
MFHLAEQIFFGLIVGTLAKLILPGNPSGGVITTAFVGLAGSAAGAFFAHAVIGLPNTGGWVLSIIGAIAALAIYQLATIARRGHEQRPGRSEAIIELTEERLNERGFGRNIH